MKPLLIAHAEDPDGVIARTLLMRQFPSGQENVFVRYDRVVEAFEEALTKAEGCSSVYVADVNPNQRLVQAGGSDFTLLEKIAKGREVYWFDHHPGTVLHKDKMTELGINVHHQENQCAALIIAQHYCLRDNYGRKLAKIAQAHDHKNTSSDAENIRIGNELEKIIALGNETLNYSLLLELSRDLQSEQCFDDNFKLRPKWQYYVNQFSRREQHAYEELERSVEIIKAGQYNVLFGYSSPLLSQKPGPFHLRKKYEQQADVFVCLFRPPVRNHMVLTNEKYSFPVLPFVQSLGGGGRGHGGGFSLDYDITPENYQQAKEMLLSQMEKYSQSNSA